ncbi:hypothetical protein GA0061071_11535 [Kosakonia oryzendophytica]|uniref:Uncharacterized protein n=1 Tax=Kosakonia oryzendophytica TaxID=1005665 RepID=A0A1C4DWV9_9ENTR|nr:hypothetical protein GA0061071_11535 [Kosakonia oryzendophytica]
MAIFFVILWRAVRMIFSLSLSGERAGMRGNSLPPVPGGDNDFLPLPLWGECRGEGEFSFSCAGR